MPGIIAQRATKNIGISFALLCLAVIIGISMRDFIMFAIPAALAALLSASTFRMIYQYKKGRLYVWTGTCVGQTKGFLPTRYDYVFRDEPGETVVIKGRALKEFREGLCYDLLFEYSSLSDVPPVFWDSCLSEKGGMQRQVKSPDE